MTSLLIIAISVLLFVYWFRYTCVLILENENSAEHFGEIAQANRLQFPAVARQLEVAPDGLVLDSLRTDLISDFRVLAHLLRHCEDFDGRSLEQRLLVLDFHLMRAWYAAAGSISRSQAVVALNEMAGILRFVSASMGRSLAEQRSRI